MLHAGDVGEIQKGVAASKGWRNDQPLNPASKDYFIHATGSHARLAGPKFFNSVTQLGGTLGDITAKGLKRLGTLTEVNITGQDAEAFLLLAGLAPLQSGHIASG
jgi:hypothetical protein